MSEIQIWIDALSQIGRTENDGVFRGSLLQPELDAHAYVAGLMREAELRVRHDAIGNLWGHSDSANPNARSTVVGSHLDSVRDGGNYDGTLGVLTGIAAVKQLLHELGPPAAPLEVVAFTGEEGSRFPLGLLGSKAVTGTLRREDLDSVVDNDGVSIADGMRKAGFDPDSLGQAERSDIERYLEVHIEQGRILESAGLPIGIVEGIVGVQRIHASVRGKSDHAGTTPISLRRDALVGAAQMISSMPDWAMGFEDGVITVGRINAFPGSSNVVPGRADFSIDVRHGNPGTLQEMLGFLERECRAIAAAHGLELFWEQPSRGNPPVRMAEELVAEIEEACLRLDVSYMRMQSGAGHDAQAMAKRFPSAMIFIPCRDGRSHDPSEFAEAEAMETGIAILTETLRRVSYGK